MEACEGVGFFFYGVGDEGRLKATDQRQSRNAFQPNISGKKSKQTQSPIFWDLRVSLTRCPNSVEYLCFCKGTLGFVTRLRENRAFVRCAHSNLFSLSAYVGRGYSWTGLGPCPREALRSKGWPSLSHWVHSFSRMN